MNMQTTANSNIKNDTWYLVLIGVLSVVVPVLVALLFYVPQTGKLGSFDVAFLPHLNAVLNSATAIALLAGFYFIKVKKNQRYHTTAMLTAFGLSSLFLISYVIYHFQGAHTKYGDLDGNGVVSAMEVSAAGTIRYLYLFILLTHIAFATIVVPFILLAIYFGISKQISRHKKIVKYTFPIWLYVAITGVLVYLMISPYYPK
jgi:putative membrane protein